jgi:DNA polymerase-4
MTMHIDLNSCFAIIEQQANRLLRGRPVGVAAYDTPRGFVVAASYEAKAKGVKLGVNVGESRSLAPGIVIMTPDPAKYREAHRLFKAVLLEYSPDVVPKSIDEFILDMSKSIILNKKVQELKNKAAGMSRTSIIKYQVSEAERLIHNKAMEEIGLGIKKRIAESLGEWVTVNIGIGTNRFLAKYAAGFGKPNGMLLIDHTNLHKWYKCGTVQARSLYSKESHACGAESDNCKTMHLMDLPGINVRYRKRLRAAGIYTTTDFLEADINTLKRVVFKSIVGYYWYLRLRGHEIDTAETKRGSIGHQVALSDKTQDIDKLERLLMKLCEKAGRRLRKNNFYATGIHLYIGFDMYRDDNNVTNAQTVEEAAGFNTHEFKKWSHGEKVPYRLYSTADIYEAAKKLLHQADIAQNVKIISVTTFGLLPWDPEQLSLFEQENQESYLPEHDYRSVNARKKVSDAIDAINNRYGEFIVTPAAMMDMSGEILDRVAFGQVQDM